MVALLSFGVGLFGVLVSDSSAVMEKGFFQGYSTTVGIVICLQVCVWEWGGGWGAESVYVYVCLVIWEAHKENWKLRLQTNVWEAATAGIVILSL